MSDQLRLFQVEGKDFQDKLYDLLLSELEKDMSASNAHLAAKDIAKRIREENMYCECGGGCACKN